MLALIPVGARQASLLLSSSRNLAVASRRQCTDLPRATTRQQPLRQPALRADTGGGAYQAVRVLLALFPLEGNDAFPIHVSFFRINLSVKGRSQMTITDWTT